jgi:hypothetical protein
MIFGLFEKENSAIAALLINFISKKKAKRDWNSLTINYIKK